MDIDAASYPKRLLAMLGAISHADFVAIDLEMTGIPSRIPKSERPYGDRRKNLEDMYAECKAAADRYSVIQFGLTCARFDWLQDKYVLTPYNVTLSPIMNDRLGFDREFCIQSGAATFLLNHGFDWGAALSSGVPYLSQEETARAKQIAYDRIDKKHEVSDVQLKAEDVQSLDFVRRVREAIVTWELGKSTVLEVTAHIGIEDYLGESFISRFQKRLVHQMIRAEFPKLMAYPKADRFYIKKLDPVREAEYKKQQKARAREQIAQHSGFRWVFEALAQGDLGPVDPLHFRNFNILPANDPGIKDRFDLIRDRLRKKQPILVGHNMFTDLTYFYRTFVGPLPDTLEQFCTKIHTRFPRIVDTKYLATHAEGDLNNSPPLNEIAFKLKNQPLPMIELEKGHNKYVGKEAYHEAGFDSMVTAEVMIRLSAKLHHEQQPDRPPSNGSTESFQTANEVVSCSPAVTVFVPFSFSVDLASRPRLTPKSRLKPGASRFNFQNKFEALSTFEPETNASSTPETSKIDLIDMYGDEWGRTTSSSDKKGTEKPSSAKPYPIQEQTRKPMEMIPAFDNAFWNVFGNTLRVFGTEERVLKLGNW